MAAIITLRQEILTGTGMRQKVQSLTVKKYTLRADYDKVIEFELLDGRAGFIPLANIAGICELKENKSFPYEE